jgi:hypothetical protein
VAEINTLQAMDATEGVPRMMDSWLAFWLELTGYRKVENQILPMEMQKFSD